MNNRTPVQTLLLVVGTLVLLGGLVCVVMSFADLASTGVGTTGEEDSAMMLFVAGGFAMVVGFGMVAFTRAAVMAKGGGYSRITIEQGVAPAGNRFCPSCGHPSSPSARFCESCGTAVG
jgi:Double zinc ribbon